MSQVSENLTDLEQDSSHLMEIKDTFYVTVGSSKDAEREIGDLSAALGILIAAISSPLPLENSLNSGNFSITLTSILSTTWQGLPDPCSNHPVEEPVGPRPRPPSSKGQVVL